MNVGGRESGEESLAYCVYITTVNKTTYMYMLPAPWGPEVKVDSSGLCRCHGPSPEGDRSGRPLRRRTAGGTRGRY